MYKYPYGDSQQLNLDWILAKLKELEAGSAGNVDLEAVSNALISLTYNPDTIYARYDYAFRNGKLYRCLSGTSGTFDPDAWQEALIGDDLAVLTRWINAINAAAVVDVKFDTTGTNGKLQQKYNDLYHDVVEVDYSPVQNSKRPLSSNAGYELNERITSINKASKSRKFVVISDSYGLGVTAGGSTTGWIERFRQYLGLTANTNLYSSAVGGSGFVGGVGVATFNDQLNTLYNTISSVADTITDVIFAGGYNDRGYFSTTLPAAIQTAVDNAKTKFQNAKIWVFSIGYYTGSDTDLPRNQLLNMNSVYCTEAIRKGAAYANVSKALKMSAAWMSTDSIHPTTAGYEEIGANIADFVQGGAIRASYDEQIVTIAPIGNITLHGTNSDKVYMRALNDNIVFYDSKILLDRFQFPAGTLTTQAYNDICTLTNSLIHGVSNLAYFPVTGFMYKAGYKEFQGFLRISNNTLSLLIRNIDNGAYEDLSTVTRLTIDFFGIKTPIDCC